jgi:hypothetical protein
VLSLSLPWLNYTSPKRCSIARSTGLKTFVPACSGQRPGPPAGRHGGPEGWHISADGEALLGREIAHALLEHGEYGGVLLHIGQ